MSMRLWTVARAATQMHIECGLGLGSHPDAYIGLTIFIS